MPAFQSRSDPTGKLEHAYLTLSIKAIPARLIYLDDNKDILATPYTLCFVSTSLLPISRRSSGLRDENGQQ
jgi:hypothetical protein